jgi:hypothetical protein
VTRALLLGRRLVAFSPEGDAEQALVRELESRKMASSAGSLLMLSAALEQALKNLRDLAPAPDGAEAAAAIAWVVGRERRAVLDERRIQAREETRSRVREVTRAAEAAARVASPPGELEDLGADGAAGSGDVASTVVDVEEIARLCSEVRERKEQMTKSMLGARVAAEEADRQATAARSKGDNAAASEAERRADVERARMHAHLGEVSRLDEELRALDRAVQAAADVPHAFTATAGAPASSGPAPRPATPSRPPRDSLEDELARLKKQGSSGDGRVAARKSGASTSGTRTSSATTSAVDDELERLKRQMSQKTGQGPGPGKGKKP